jgi:hypothetical protein
LRQGVELIEVRCGALNFSVVPTRGMGIWKAAWKGVEFGWQSPVRGPIHPAFVPLYDPSGLGWLDGFDELLARCGLESNGAPDFDPAGKLRYPLHGRIANTPAEHVEVHLDPHRQTLDVRGRVVESRFHFQKLELTTVVQCRVGHSAISIFDEVTNRSGRPATFQLLYHFNFGPPLLGTGARLAMPVREVAPRDIVAANGIDHWDEFAAPDPGAAEQVFFVYPFADARHQTTAVLHNAERTRAVMLSYDLRHLPCFTLWKNGTSAADGYVAGLEPATNFPNRRSFEESRNRVVSLGPDESCRFRLELEFLAESSRVANAIRVVEAMQAAPPHRFLWPSPHYSADVDESLAKA